MIYGVLDATDPGSNPVMAATASASVQCAPCASLWRTRRTVGGASPGGLSRVLVPVRSCLCSFEYLGHLRSWPVLTGLS